MKTTFELIEQYFNSNQYDCEKKVIVDYVLNGTTIKIQYKKYAEERLKDDGNFGWKSRAIIKLDSEGNELKEYSSLKSYAEEHNCAIGSVGKALKKGTKCKGFYLKYKTVD